MTHRLLLVEDSPLQAELLRADLERSGYEVAVAADGDEALVWLSEHEPPDAVVSDVMMPRMSGYELCQRIKADRRLAEVPVLLLTTLRDPVDIVRGLECGADNFLTKPYDLEQLLQRLDTVLRSADLRAAGRFRMGVEVLLLGHTFTVNADRQQILDMLMSSFEDLVHTNQRLREREEELQQARDELTTQVEVSEEHRRELEETRLELRQTLGHAGVATWRLTLPDGRFEWSDNAPELFGLARDFPLDRLDLWLDRVHPDDRPALQGLVDHVSSSPDAELPDEWEYRVDGDDGLTRWFTGRGQLLRNGNGHVSVIGVAIDTSHRRQLEEDLRQREQTLSAVLAASPDAILVTGRDGLITFASERVADIIGVTADAMLGRSPREFLADDDEEVLYRGAGSVRLRDGAATDHLRLSVHHADGHLVTVDARIGQLTDDHGMTTGYVAVVRDVTEQARLEAELARAKDEADRANQAKSEYLSRMSHELRTPMNTVLGFAQLLQLSDLQPEDEDSVERILRAGRHLLQLIDDVLDIARIESGNVEVSSEPVAVGPVARAAADLVQHQAEERDVSIHLPDDCDEWAHVLADQQRLSQVLINLLSNAVKYNRPGGGIDISCEGVGPGWHRIAVSDTGYGIPEEQLQRVFTPFDRLGADRTQVTGTGLGLALSRGLVEMMGGRIGCDSTVGEGSTFWVELREASRPTSDEDGAPPDVDAGSGAPAGTVLYVEDNPMNFELVRRALASAPDLELLHAGTGEEGLDVARRRRPDLVLLDLHLAGRSGRDVLGELRTDPATRGLPVVIVSADATTTSTDELLDAGADDYLTKPFDLRELRALVTRFLDRSDDQREEP